MVNLEEILEKKVYQVPAMQIEYLSWEDIIVTSLTGNEGGVDVVTPGEVDLGELEDGN